MHVLDHCSLVLNSLVSKLYVTRADPGFGNGGAKISSEARYIYERSELRRYIYERSELRAKRVTSEASINQLGVRGAL